MFGQKWQPIPGPNTEKANSNSSEPRPRFVNHNQTMNQLEPSKNPDLQTHNNTNDNNVIGLASLVELSWYIRLELEVHCNDAVNLENICNFFSYHTLVT